MLAQISKIVRSYRPDLANNLDYGVVGVSWVLDIIGRDIRNDAMDSGDPEVCEAAIACLREIGEYLDFKVRNPNL